jgi:uncharacterized protein
MAVLPIPAAGAGSQEYVRSIEVWRQERLTRLTADDGWLTLAGLHWLKEGSNRFGAAVDNDIVLPPGSAPDHAGVFEFHAGKVRVRANPGAGVTLHGEAVGAIDLEPDLPGPPDILAVRDLSLFVIQRGDRYAIRVKDKESRTRREFRGLEYFPIDPAYRVVASFSPGPPGRTIEVPNVLGQIEKLPSPGDVGFTLQGRAFKLEPVLEEPGATELFFIFRDETSGKETYPSGRFLYAEMPKDGKVVIDFNKAYTPPCAFTPYATCVLPPRQNWLPVRIEAGEKSAGHHGG